MSDQRAFEDSHDADAADRAYWDKVDAAVKGRTFTGSPYRDLLFTRADGTQVLITLWADGHSTMAERANTAEVWGPPLDAQHDSARELP